MSIKPKIMISSLDAERLEMLLETLSHNAFPGRDDLEAELARAEVVDPEEIPPTVVTMNSTVRFRVESSAEEFCLTLVYPKDIDTREKRFRSLRRWEVHCWGFRREMKSSGQNRVVVYCVCASWK